MTDARSLWPDTRRVIALAAPVALAELGWMGMGVVDTIMVGRLGPAAIGAIGIGSSAFYSFAIFGVGLLLGLDTLVSQSFGAGDREDCHHSLAQGVYIALLLAPPLTILFALMRPAFYALGIVAPVSGLAGAFVATLGLSTLPLLLYGAFRRYLQATAHVRPVMVALISANLINWFFNWLFIYGHWSFPAMGVVGSALSTCLARVYMAVFLALCIWWFERGVAPGVRSVIRKPDWQRIALLLRIGLPAATQILLEIGAFGAAAVLAGRLNPVALAAHQIALNCAAVSFMVPLGVSSAAAVAVGHADGTARPTHGAPQRVHCDRPGLRFHVVFGCRFPVDSKIALAHLHERRQRDSDRHRTACLGGALSTLRWSSNCRDRRAARARQYARADAGESRRLLVLRVADRLRSMLPFRLRYLWHLVRALAGADCHRADPFVFLAAALAGNTCEQSGTHGDLKS